MRKITAGSVVTSLAISFVLSVTAPVAALAAGPAAINLGTAGNYAVLAKTGISTTGSTSIGGNIGVSPAAASYITGFALTLPASGAFSTSALVTGKVYAPGYADPTPANLTTAVSDMETAFTDGMGRTNPTATELGAGNIGGMTLAPGLYKWGTGVTIPVDVTLSGGANDVWIFQIAQGLDVSSAAKVILAGGAQASNIFWVVAGQTTIGTTAVMNGNILDQTAIVLNTGATLNGRALAQTAVTLDSNAVTFPNSSSSVTPVMQPTPAPTVTPATQNPTTTGTQTTQSTSATASSRLTASQIQSILTVLASFNADASVIANVRASLEGTNTGSVTSTAVHVFMTNLTAGSLGSEVKALQQFLNSHGFIVANTGAGSPGNETMTFGPATKAALIKFQQASNISPAIGNFGPLTRAYLSSHY